MLQAYNRLLRYLGLMTIVVFGVISTLGTNGDDGDGVTPVTYTGLETQALITADNAQPLGDVAFVGVTAGSFVSIAIDQQAPDDGSRTTPVITIARLLHSVLGNIDSSDDLRLSPTGWIETEPPLPGLCGGSVSGSSEVNETDRSFTGTIIFNQWCNFGFTMNGTVPFSGMCDAATFDPATQTCDIIDYAMEFTNFNAREEGYSETMSGTLASTVTAAGYETTLNLVMRLDYEKVTFKWEDYKTVATVDSPPGYDSVVVTGKAYHPEFGYAVVSTPTPVEFYTDSLDSPPLTGVALLTGDVGASGSTTATYTFIDSNSFQIAVDTDGDSVTDVTWNCSWNTGDCI
ncbi:hypothetical protein [Kaarinaea lacus]